MINEEILSLSNSDCNKGDAVTSIPLTTPKVLIRYKYFLLTYRGWFKLIQLSLTITGLIQLFSDAKDKFYGFRLTTFLIEVTIFALLLLSMVYHSKAYGTYQQKSYNWRHSAKYELIFNIVCSILSITLLVLSFIEFKKWLNAPVKVAVSAMHRTDVHTILLLKLFSSFSFVHALHMESKYLRGMKSYGVVFGSATEKQMRRCKLKEVFERISLHFLLQKNPDQQANPKYFLFTKRGIFKSVQLMLASACLGVMICGGFFIETPLLSVFYTLIPTALLLSIVNNSVLYQRCQYLPLSDSYAECIFNQIFYSMSFIFGLLVSPIYHDKTGYWKVSLRTPVMILQSIVFSTFLLGLIMELITWRHGTKTATVEDNSRNGSRNDVELSVKHVVEINESKEASESVRPDENPEDTKNQRCVDITEKKPDKDPLICDKNPEDSVRI